MTVYPLHSCISRDTVKTHEADQTQSDRNTQKVMDRYPLYLQKSSHFLFLSKAFLSLRYNSYYREQNDWPC